MWIVDKGIQATKKGIDNLKEKRETRKSGSGDNSPSSSNDKGEKQKRPSQFGENFTKLFKSYTSPNSESKPSSSSTTTTTGPIPMPMPGSNNSNNPSSTTNSQNGPIPMPGSQQNMPPPFGSTPNQNSSHVNDGGGIYPNLS